MYLHHQKTKFLWTTLFSFLCFFCFVFAFPCGTVKLPALVHLGLCSVTDPLRACFHGLLWLQHFQPLLYCRLIYAFSWNLKIVSILRHFLISLSIHFFKGNKLHFNNSNNTEVYKDIQKYKKKKIVIPSQS